MNTFEWIAKIKLILVVIKGLLLVWIFLTKAPEPTLKMSFLKRLRMDAKLIFRDDIAVQKDIRWYQFRWRGFILTIVLLIIANIFQYIYATKTLEDLGS